MPQDAKPTVGYPIFTLGLPIPSANATALAHRSVQPSRKFGDLQALQRDAAIRVEGVGGLGVIRGLCQEDDRYVNGWVSGKFYRKLRKPCFYHQIWGFPGFLLVKIEGPVWYTIYHHLLLKG